MTMAATVLNGPDELRAAVGQHLGSSDWLTIEQDRINQFAEATGDHQWIHVDEQRAKAGPFGATIAHGYLTLSLVSYLMPKVMQVTGFSMGINYGLNKVRFITPVTVGSRIRVGGELMDVSDVPGGLQTIIVITTEIDGVPKPACVAESISRWMV
jgi:acyl dehydratase